MPAFKCAPPRPKPKACTGDSREHPSVTEVQVHHHSRFSASDGTVHLGEDQAFGANSGSHRGLAVQMQPEFLTCFF